MKPVRSRMIAKLYLMSCLVVSLLTPSALLGQSEGQAVPRLVQFTGVVKDDAGRVKTGVVGVTFALYKDQDGGAGTTAPQEKLDVAGKVRSQNLAAIATQSNSVNASSGLCLGALLSTNSACDTPNLAITATTGNVPVFIVANLNGLATDSCTVANFGLVMDGNIIVGSNLQIANTLAPQSLSVVSLQFPAPGTHTFEVQESDDTGTCSGGHAFTIVGWPSNTSSNFSTSTLIVREF